MGKLLSAVLFIVIFSFCLVFSFDRNNTQTTRAVLRMISLVTAIIVAVLVYFILRNPYY